MDAQTVWARLRSQSVSSLALELGVRPLRLVRMLEEAGMMGNDQTDPTPRHIRAGQRKAKRRWSSGIAEGRRIGRRCSLEGE